MKKLLVLGTGSSIDDVEIDYSEFDTLAWSSSFHFCTKNGFYPKYYSFIDPHSALSTINYISIFKKPIPTEILLFSDVVDIDYATFRSKVGSSQMMKKNDNVNWEWNYKSVFLEPLKAISDRCKVSPLKTKTVREEGVDLNKRFDYTEIIIGDENLKKGKGTYNQDKLTLCIFPLIHWLPHTEIYLAGFDALTGRYDNPKNFRGNPCMQKSYDDNMPIWMEHFKSCGKTLHSLMNRSYINKWLKTS